MPNQGDIAPNQEDIATWVATPLKTGEFICLKGIRANDLPSDDICAVCRLQYGTPDFDIPPEHAVRFPCGHAIGNACFPRWLESELAKQRKPRCMLCQKGVIPDQFLSEQVEEIWSIASKMSPEAVKNEYTGTRMGPLRRAMEMLVIYLNEAIPSLSHLKTPNKVLALNWEWLHLSANSFYGAVRQHVSLCRSGDIHEKDLITLGVSRDMFQLSYKIYQDLIKEMVVEWANQGTLDDKDLSTRAGRFHMDTPDEKEVAQILQLCSVILLSFLGHTNVALLHSIIFLWSQFRMDTPDDENLAQGLRFCSVILLSFLGYTRFALLLSIIFLLKQFDKTMSERNSVTTQN